MTPPLLTLALYGLFAAASAIELRRAMPLIGTQEALPRLALLAICVVAWFVGPHVYGLEYEDAYVHEASSLWRSSHWGDAGDGFYATVCFAGSAADCVLQGSFGTQLIGPSVLGATIYLVCDCRTGAVPVASAVAGALTLQVFWSLLIQHVPSKLARAGAITLMAAAPAFYLVSGSGFAEPLFLFFLLTYLRWHLQLNASLPKNAAVPWVLLITAGALMILAKKEGVLLIILLAAHAAGGSWFSRNEATPVRFIALGLLAVALALLMFAFFGVHILDAAERHSADIGRPAFSLLYISRLAGPFAASALTPENFGLSFWAMLPALLAALYVSRGIASMPLGIVAAFSALYLLHARHFAFSRGAEVEPAEMVRYLYVLTPFATLFVAHSLGRVTSALGQGYLWPHRLSSGMGSAVLATLGFIVAIPSLYQERVDMAGDERQNRTQALSTHPASGAIIYISPYSAALTSALGREGLIVDSAALEEPKVLDWLGLRIKAGATLVIDPNLCKAEVVSATCQILTR